MKGIPEKL